VGSRVALRAEQSDQRALTAMAPAMVAAMAEQAHSQTSSEFAAGSTLAVVRSR